MKILNCISCRKKHAVLYPGRSCVHWAFFQLSWDRHSSSFVRFTIKFKHFHDRIKIFPPSGAGILAFGTPENCLHSRLSLSLSAWAGLLPHSGEPCIFVYWSHSFCSLDLWDLNVDSLLQSFWRNSPGKSRLSRLGGALGSALALDVARWAATGFGLSLLPGTSFGMTVGLAQLLPLCLSLTFCRDPAYVWGVLCHISFLDPWF